MEHRSLVQAISGGIGHCGVVNGSDRTIQTMTSSSRCLYMSMCRSSNKALAETLQKTPRWDKRFCGAGTSSCRRAERQSILIDATISEPLPARRPRRQLGSQILTKKQILARRRIRKLLPLHYHPERLCDEFISVRRLVEAIYGYSKHREVSRCLCTTDLTMGMEQTFI